MMCCLSNSALRVVASFRRECWRFDMLELRAPLVLCGSGLLCIDSRHGRFVA